MLIDLIVDLLIQGPLMLLEIAFYRSTCPKCGGRLKYVPRTKNRVQCVMCERFWLNGKHGALTPVDANSE